MPVESPLDAFAFCMDNCMGKGFTSDVWTTIAPVILAGRIPFSITDLNIKL